MNSKLPRNIRGLSAFICVYLRTFFLPLACTALFLSACGTAPKKPEPGQPVSPKYYSDDGPPEKVPDNLADVPDAVPRDEPFHKFANRPYTVFGQTYVPVVNKDPSKERGLASWYGRKFHGQKTASGEVYDMFAMTAAHKTLPIPSYAKVTNVKTGQSVVVRVNDRGPFHSNRIIDLSYAAAARIGIAQAGSGMVEVERLVPPFDSGETLALAAPAPPASATVKTPVVASEGTALWLQLGAFSSLEGAENFRTHVAGQLTWVNEQIEIVSHEGLHRVRMGPYKNLEEAAAIGDKVRRTLGVAPALIQR
jgi:rare lipoprotein A